jgi:hypothetical protein
MTVSDLISFFRMITVNAQCSKLKANLRVNKYNTEKAVAYKDMYIAT